MSGPVEILRIPDADYADYRYKVIFGAYKWDPQVEDQNTVSRYVVRLAPDTAAEIASMAEALARETALMEEAMVAEPALIHEMGLPRPIERATSRLGNYNPAGHVRLMRFDFHPTDTGWAVSEVNSDVPGGLAEASVLPRMAAQYFEDCEPRYHVGESLLRAFRPLLPADGCVAFVHATSYADDRQVMQFLGDYFAEAGYRPIYAAPDHINWAGRRAVSIIIGAEGPVDGIVRFFPLEWLCNLPARSGWAGYYDGETPACNHPIAILTQSKRLPLVWDKLGIDVPAWRTLLPETADPRTIHKAEADWIYKPALGRVGEGISIKGTMPDREARQIARAAHRHHRDWAAQRMFNSQAVTAADGACYHLCVGVFTVNGKCAGFYGRISPYPRIDARAIDIPILVAKEGETNGKNEHRAL